MPNIKSAKKKMRQDVKRRKGNQAYSKKVKDILKKVTGGTKNAESIKKAYSVIDKAAKKRIIHKNKAARLKAKVSRISKKTNEIPH